MHRGRSQPDVFVSPARSVVHLFSSRARIPSPPPAPHTPLTPPPPSPSPLHAARLCESEVNKLLAPQPNRQSFPPSCFQRSNTFKYFPHEKCGAKFFKLNLREHAEPGGARRSQARRTRGRTQAAGGGVDSCGVPLIMMIHGRAELLCYAARLRGTD